VRDLLITGTVRENSSRLPNKLTRKFGDTTLFDLYMQKLTEIKKATPFNVVVGINPKDKTLWEISKKYSIEVASRNDTSSRQGSVLNEIFNYLENYDEEYIMWINSCFPFIEPNTLIKIANKFIEDENIKSLHCIRKVDNWFWIDSKPINIKSKKHSRTQDALPIYESVHCTHIFNKQYMFDNCSYFEFTENHPYLYELGHSKEFLDVDTEFDFKLCEAVYKCYE